MLGYPKDVEEMCLGQNGILTHMKPGYSYFYIELS